MARYLQKLDSKGRLLIPAPIRQRDPKLFYVTRSLDEGFLALYTEERFLEISKALMSLSGTSSEVRLLRRLILGEALECPLDASGRILIRSELLSVLDFKSSADSVCLIDMVDCLQLCTSDRYELEFKKDFGSALKFLENFPIPEII